MSADRPVGPGSKGKRGPVSSSCLECRRLKIRCQREDSGEWPCISCKKRGCTGICPNGTLPEGLRRGDGTAEALKKKNKQLATRVRELEALLASKDISYHRPAPTDAQEDPDDIDTLAEDFGTLKIDHDTGKTVWHASHAPSHNFLPEEPSADISPLDATLPMELLVLALSFPFSGPVSNQNTVKNTMRSLVPTYEECTTIINSFFTYATWLGSPVTREELYDDILIPCVREATWDEIPAEKLALLFAVLAVGMMVDVSRPPYSDAAFKMHQLAAAALNLSKPLDSPSFTALQAIQLYLYGLQVSDSPSAVNRFWIITGIAFRMAISLGVHRDCKNSGLTEREDQARRRVFWQLATLDAVISIAYGRPMFFNPRHYDCPLPRGENMGDGLPELSRTRYLYLKSGLIPMLDEAFGAQPPTYAKVLSLDKHIRELPKANPVSIGVDVSKAGMSQLMSLFCVQGVTQVALLYLHRRYFIESFNGNGDPMQSKYKQSFLIAFRTACAMLRQIRFLFDRDPLLVPRLFFLWMHAFSATVIVATVVLRAPGCEFAETAASELDLARKLFEDGQASRRAQRALATVRRLNNKANEVMALHRAGHHVPPVSDIVERFNGQSPSTNSGANCAQQPPPIPAASQSLPHGKSYYAAHQNLFDKGWMPQDDPPQTTDQSQPNPWAYPANPFKDQAAPWLTPPSDGSIASEPASGPPQMAPTQAPPAFELPITAQEWEKFLEPVAHSHAQSQPAVPSQTMADFYSMISNNAALSNNPPLPNPSTVPAAQEEMELLKGLEWEQLLR